MTWAILGDSNTRAIGEMISTDSERVLAVVGGALLDEHVNRTLSERLRDDSGAVVQLLGVDRALGNMGPKIDLLYLLYGLDTQTRSALKALTNVRNYFAHNLDVSFDSIDKTFVSSLGQLKLHEGITHYPNPLMEGAKSEYSIEPIKNRRDQFTVNLKLGLIALMQDRQSHLVHSNESNKSGVA